VDFVPKTKIEILADDAEAEKIIEIIQKSAHTGKIGDGKIYVSSLETLIRIRTGETDQDAI
jgi:nitrogen regulatory protein PII